MPVPSTALFSLLHCLIPVIILSSEIPVTGRVRKESVKVCTSKSPPSADDSPLDLAAVHVFAYRARAQAQQVRSFAQRQEFFPNRRRHVSFRFLSLFHCGFPFGCQRSSHFRYSPPHFGGVIFLPSPTS